MTAYAAGTMLMLQDTIALIGCAAAMPRDHKNEWLQNKFSLYPAARIQKTAGKGTHLLWKKTDVERARKMWLEFSAPPMIRAEDILKERKQFERDAIEKRTPGWITFQKDKTPSELGLAMISLAEQLLQQAATLLSKTSVA